tara:strand:+ start:10661 stop:14209 length:3549 start_codon:yes stop_codon:yes gene_type:complete
MDIIDTKEQIDGEESIQKMIRKNREKLEKKTKKKGHSKDNNQTRKSKSVEKKTRLNEKIAEMLEKLSILMQKKGDVMRARVYSRALDTVLLETGDITDIKELEGKPGIGPTIMVKMNEYISTGKLSVLEKEKENPLIWLTEIHGIGPKKATELIEKGIYKIEDLEGRKDELLNNVQKKGLQYYEEINQRIPRDEIDEYKKILESSFKKVADEESKQEIVGSYRRGSRTSGDIDVIITSKKEDVLKSYMEELKEKGIIIEVLSNGKTKSMVIARLNKESIARRVDFMYSPKEEYPFAILYFTGSKVFNTVMRGYALKLGLSLNEHGIYKKEKGKTKEDKVSKKFNNEEDIFEYLHLKYKMPEERIDGRAVETTIPIIKDEENKNVEKKGQSCYKSCDNVPVSECVTGCEPSWGDEKLNKSRNWCSCNLNKEDCGKHLCPIHTEPTMLKQRTPEKKQRKPRLLKEQKKGSPKRKYVKKPKIIIEENEKVEAVPIIEKEELPELVPIIAVNMPEPKKVSPKNKTKKITLKKNDNINKEKMPKTKKNKNMELGKVSILEFKEKGIMVLEGMSEKGLEEMIELANHQYYNTKNPLLTDAEYDIIVEYMERKHPNNLVLQGVGAKVEKNKVRLPYEMASMDKIKPDTNALITWKSKYSGQYVLSCKLDGVSGLYTTENGEAKLYTRGDGKVGQDITHLLKVLKLPKHEGYVVRGEFIILKEVFEEKYSKSFANPRNLVSGIVNSKTIDEKARDLHFVAYEVIKPEMKPSEQMNKLIELEHEVVKHQIEEDITNEQLSEILIDWRTNYKYEIDGVIVSDDRMHIRKSGNPEHAFAFKMVISDQVAEAKVLDVLWTPSKSGYLKPRVRIEPIRLGGVTIEYATGFNGKFIEDNKIGIGAIIEIVRSGDVIPHIKSITTPAESAKMPIQPYHWTDTHVDIVLDDVSEDETVQEKNITAFFTGIGVDGLSTGNVKRLMKAGYNTVPKIVHMKKADYNGVEGFKEKMINKVYDGIKDKLEKATLIEIMAASNMLGRGIGTRKITPIMEAYPNILTSSESIEEKKDMLLKVNGIGNENAKSFVENIAKFMSFLEEIGLKSKLEIKLENTIVEKEEAKDESHPLFGKRIVMTKVRDKYIIEQVGKVGGIMEDTFSKKTDILITKSHEDESNKTKKAKEMGIPIMIPAEFVKKYDL